MRHAGNAAHEDRALDGAALEGQLGAVDGRRSLLPVCNAAQHDRRSAVESADVGERTLRIEEDIARILFASFLAFFLALFRLGRHCLKRAALHDDRERLYMRRGGGLFMRDVVKGETAAHEAVDGTVRDRDGRVDDVRGDRCLNALTRGRICVSIAATPPP